MARLPDDHRAPMSLQYACAELGGRGGRRVDQQRQREAVDRLALRAPHGVVPVGVGERDDDAAVFEEISRELDRGLELTAGVVAQIEDQPRRPCSSRPPHRRVDARGDVGREGAEGDHPEAARQEAHVEARARRERHEVLLDPGGIHRARRRALARREGVKDVDRVGDQHRADSVVGVVARGRGEQRDARQPLDRHDRIAHREHACSLDGGVQDARLVPDVIGMIEP